MERGAVAGFISAWRLMPKEAGRLYCAVVREEGGNYRVIGVNSFTAADMTADELSVSPLPLYMWCMSCSLQLHETRSAWFVCWFVEHIPPPPLNFLCF